MPPSANEAQIMINSKDTNNPIFEMTQSANKPIEDLHFVTLSVILIPFFFFFPTLFCVSVFFCIFLTNLVSNRFLYLFLFLLPSFFPSIFLNFLLTGFVLHFCLTCFFLHFWLTRFFLHFCLSFFFLFVLSYFVFLCYDEARINHGHLHYANTPMQ